jgi:hypothetical protein
MFHSLHVILIVLSYTFSNVYFPGVHEIAYGIGGPSEKNVSPHLFSIAKYRTCVTP